MAKSALASYCIVLAFFALALPLQAQPVRRDFSEKSPEREKIYKDEIAHDFDLRFGSIVRIEDNIATVRIISRIYSSDIQPSFFACDVLGRPVAELESMHTGYKDCFLFSLIRGQANLGDDVIVRYYKVVKVEDLEAEKKAEKKAEKEDVNTEKQKKPKRISHR